MTWFEDTHPICFAAASWWGQRKSCSPEIGARTDSHYPAMIIAREVVPVRNSHSIPRTTTRGRVLTEKCPACLSEMKRLSPWLSGCAHCGLYVSNLAPGPGKAFDGLEELRRRNFETILDAVEDIRPLRGARLLEVGSSKGWFLDAGRNRGAVVSGIEPVAADAAVARSMGLQIEEGLFPSSPADKGPYDLIVFNDVFEHMPDPIASARAANDLLADDGLLVINIPSSKGAIFRIARLLNAAGVSGPYDRMWQRGLPSPHMTYFSPANLKRLVEAHTKLRLWTERSLPSVSRNGLKERVDSRGIGVPSGLAMTLAWCLSFVLPLLPSDIHLSIFTKGKFYRQ